MNDEFWRDRWAKGLIGFHEAEPNALLRAHFGRLRDGFGPHRPRVLVPLCGKSNDLAFLAARGFDVTGIEVVPEAARAFFQERSLTPVEERWEGFESLRAGGVRIAVGSFFDLALAEGERFDVAYDRAALIAVPPEARERYVATLMEALGPQAKLLLVTFFQEGGHFTGPPFSVGTGDVNRLFTSHRRELLEEKDLTEVETRFRERGATRIGEQAWLVAR